MPSKVPSNETPKHRRERLTRRVDKIRRECSRTAYQGCRCPGGGPRCGGGTPEGRRGSNSKRAPRTTVTLYWYSGTQ